MGTKIVELTEALARVKRRRLERARDILLQQIRQGNADLSDVGSDEEVVAVLYRYTRAAQEGAARLNLRLMAKVIAGQVAVGPLYADEFLRWASVLEGLSREEVMRLAATYRQQDAHPDDPGARKRATKAELVPSVFSTEEEFYAAGGALTRTGLLSATPGWGEMVFKGTPQLERLVRLASLDAAIQEEREEGGTR